MNYFTSFKSPVVTVILVHNYQKHYSPFPLFHASFTVLIFCITPYQMFRPLPSTRKIAAQSWKSFGTFMPSFPHQSTNPCGFDATKDVLSTPKYSFGWRVRLVHVDGANQRKEKSVCQRQSGPAWWIPHPTDIRLSPGGQTTTPRVLLRWQQSYSRDAPSWPAYA